MVAKIRSQKGEEKNPLDWFQSFSGQFDSSLRQLLKVMGTEEGRHMVTGLLKSEVGEMESALSKKQQWVLKAMEQDPKLEAQIFEYSKFTHSQFDGSKRIIIRGINEETTRVSAQ